MTIALLGSEDILAIAGDLWASYLGDEPLPSVAGLVVPEVSATVSVVGEWNGLVVVGTSVRGARLVGSVLLEIDEADLSDGDVNDAFGELVNIIGGNVKSVLPGPSSLSLPLVSAGAVTVSERGAAIVAEAALEWQGEQFEITVWSSIETKGA
ncbi:chemotaxis protein CheX [Motilibacter peucedani]|uniref:Chemotaxis protein CheX n=1 Tax=Motilibacter peucedani TaxID=598650 RepID=A0A420XTM7_9ACTN|nr:chemotaxis protein CheX [Motilibacter peucedani]RKS80188.1 chemotaxis protein CheX [Motilibacter peucedani]